MTLYTLQSGCSSGEVIAVSYHTIAHTETRGTTEPWEMLRKTHRADWRR